MKMMISKEKHILNLVNSKLQSRRDELMFIINESLSSYDPKKIEVIYNSQIELANIEKAIELNSYFQSQVLEMEKEVNKIKNKQNKQ